MRLNGVAAESVLQSSQRQDFQYNIKWSSLWLKSRLQVSPHKPLSDRKVESSPFQTEFRLKSTTKSSFAYQWQRFFLPSSKPYHDTGRRSLPINRHGTQSLSKPQNEPTLEWKSIMACAMCTTSSAARSPFHLPTQGPRVGVDAIFRFPSRHFFFRFYCPKVNSKSPPCQPTWR